MQQPSTSNSFFLLLTPLLLMVPPHLRRRPRRHRQTPTQSITFLVILVNILTQSLTGLASNDCNSFDCCPPGTYSLNCSVLAEGESSDNNCQTCHEGLFCPGGTYPPRQCPSGNFCPEGTDYPISCPKGHYCPQGSRAAMPCEVGTYNSLTRRSNESACVKCRPGQYNGKSGMEACFPCSKSSASIPSRYGCACIGKYRAFQSNDGACLCHPRYEAYSRVNYGLIDGDSVVDCQPKVYDRCFLPGYSRDQDGSCKKAKGQHCECRKEKESNREGRWIDGFGCQCQAAHNKKVALLEQVCNDECQHSFAGSVVVGVNSSSSSPVQNLSYSLGRLDVDTGRVLSVSFSSEGAKTSYVHG